MQDTASNTTMEEMPISPICALTWYLPESRRLFPIKISLCPNVPENGEHKITFLFQRLMKDLKEEKQEEPFLKLVQTSSSHEPFEVPFHRLDDKVLNSFAYADSCVGNFVKQYQETPLWKNTLFVLVPDHQGAYPYPIENPLDGQTIPLILIGGAIKQPLVIDTYASQIDIAATLLAQLGLPHDEFTFSKNILNPGSPHFAYFTRPDYFGMITADNQLVYNLDANTVQLDEGTAKGANLEKGKAFLQKLYDDLAKR